MTSPYCQIYCDLTKLHSKVHTYHIRTVNTPESATLHATLGSVYEKLDELRDMLGENVLIKFLDEGVPSESDTYRLSNIYDSIDWACASDIAKDVYGDLEKIEAIIWEQLDEEDNRLAQLVWPVREQLTNLCADMARELCNE